MPKLQLKGFIQEVSKIHFYGEKNFPKQVILLMVPGYVDEFGEKKSPDDFWQISIMGDSIDKFNIHERHVGSKVVIEVYVNSRPYTNKTTQLTGYIVNVSLAKIEFLDQSKPNHTPQGNHNPEAQNFSPAILRPGEDDKLPGEEDDLPF